VLLVRGNDSNFAGLMARSSAARCDICALTLMALVLNLVHIGTTSIVLDESTSVKFARLSCISLFPVLAGRDPNMGLYYLLLNLWVRIFGESETAVRALSAVFGALAVSAIYLLGSRLFGRRVGIVAGVLLALDAFIVQYAQTARSYALLVWLVTLSAYFLVVDLEQPSKRSRIGYVLTSTLAVYAHYFAVYVLIVQLGTVAIMRRSSAQTREWLCVTAAILLLCAPEAIFAYRAGAGLIGWIGKPSLGDIVPVLVDFAGGSRMLLLVLLVGGFIATGFAIRERQFWPVGFLVAWLMLPVALAFVISFVVPMFVSYYLIICVPALIMLGTAAIARLRQPVLAGVLVAALVGISAANLVAFYSSARGENWRDATGYVLGATRPGDAIVFYPDFAHKPFDYYQRQSGVSGPTNVEGQAPVDRYRVWLVIRESDAAASFPEIQHLQSALAERYRLVERRSFRRVGVELYAH
jgi:mannosyltransferase